MPRQVTLFELNKKQNNFNDLKFIDFSSKKLKAKTLQSEEFDPRKHNPVFYGHGYLFSILDDEKLLVSWDILL